jgi:hypothetical protein
MELKEKNIDSLIYWCQNQKILLENIGSNLQFEALKLKVNKNKKIFHKKRRKKIKFLLNKIKLLVYYSFKNQILERMRRF